ncbi:MAG: ArsR family transcriptional regulator, partial [Chloroflexota bacterium]
MTKDNNSSPQVYWDFGTSYDFFASLEVLHDPARFGLRGAWAAGVRSRLNSEDRRYLEDVVAVFPVPLRWVYNLPEPKDAATALYILKQIPAEERLSELTDYFGKQETPYVLRLKEILGRGHWDEDDLDSIYQDMNKHYRGIGVPRLTRKQASVWLDFHAYPKTFGERYLSILQSYFDVFFSEEEKRIEKISREALEKGQALSDELPLAELLEELSRGLRYDELPKVGEIVLIPSYWFSPILMQAPFDADRILMLFGARPQGESLVPGEIVPDDIIKSLKALADPTRLRIMRFLMEEQLTQAELARRLRLRAPTVTHHLHALRLAGLVHYVVGTKHDNK